MNELKIFANKEFGEIRTLNINNEPWFVGKDVANILGYQNGSRDINRHVDEDDKQKAMVFDGNQNKETTLINESGLYSLILSSKMPNAKKFKRWVTTEILPSIRKNGGYIVNQENLSNEELLAKAILVANNVIEEKNKLIEQQSQQLIEQKPLVGFAQQVSDSSDCVDVGEFAKTIRDENIKMGRNNLFKWLKSNHYLMSNNNPYQKYINNGMFKVVEVVKKTPYGTKVFTKTLITGVGQIRLLEKIRESYGDNK